MAPVSSSKVLNGLLEQGADWIDYLVSADEPRGNIGDCANARAEIYRLQALFQMLSTQVQPQRHPCNRRRLVKRESLRRCKRLSGAKKSAEHSRYRTRVEFEGGAG